MYTILCCRQVLHDSEVAAVAGLPGSELQRSRYHHAAVDALVRYNAAAADVPRRRGSHAGRARAVRGVRRKVAFEDAAVCIHSSIVRLPVPHPRARAEHHPREDLCIPQCSPQHSSSRLDVQTR